MNLNKQKFYFLHIPKTSGTSLTFALDKLFTTEQKFPYQTWHDLVSQPTTIKEKLSAIESLFGNKYGFVRGHFGNIAEISKDRFVFTMFRRPYLRTISQLRHMHWVPFANWIDPTKMNAADTYMEMLKIPAVADYIKDVQTKYLLSRRSIRKDLHIEAKSFDYHDSNNSEIGKPINLPSLIVYPLMIYRLLKLDFFGIQEFFEESVELLSFKLGVEIEIPQGKLQTRGQVSEQLLITDEDREILESYNGYDNVLYKIARKIFLMRWCNYLKSEHKLEVSPKFYLENRTEIRRQLNDLKLDEVEFSL